MGTDNNAQKENKKQNGRDYMLRKLELANRRDTKVVYTRTPESNILYLIMTQADIGISTLKSRLFQDGYSVDEVEALIKEFYSKCRELEDTVLKIHKKCGFKVYKRAKELG